MSHFRNVFGGGGGEGTRTSHAKHFLTKTFFSDSISQKKKNSTFCNSTFCTVCAQNIYSVQYFNIPILILLQLLGRSMILLFGRSVDSNGPIRLGHLSQLIKRKQNTVIDLSFARATEVICSVLYTL
jgi:hypothetical protein